MDEPKTPAVQAEIHSAHGQRRLVAELSVEFARLYTSLVEALRQQGCDEEVARSEARQAAITHLELRREELLKTGGERCPLCGGVR